MTEEEAIRLFSLAATIIQAHVRGYLVRKKFDFCQYRRRNYAAASIQAVWYKNSLISFWSIILNPLPFPFPTVSFPFPCRPFSSPICPFFPLIFHHLLFPFSYLQISSSPTAILTFISSPFSFFLSRCHSFPFPSHSIPFHPVPSLFFSLPSFLFTSVAYPFSSFRSYPSPPLLFLSVPFSLAFL